MKKEIKVGDNTFELNIPDAIDKPVYDTMVEWCKLIENQKIDEDEWYTIPALPQYQFKNLKWIINQNENENFELTINFIYDDFKEQKPED